MPKPIADRRLRSFLIPAIVILALALVAATATPTPAGPATFDVSQGDNFFEADEFTVSPGQQLTFNLTNNGQSLHNMHIAGTDNTFDATLCEVGGDEPCSGPAALSPGDSAVLTWTAPEEPGTFDFRCDFHPTEMTGTVIVE